jgi:hypothetical protein
LGGASGCALIASISATIESGRTKRKDLALGPVFAALAVAVLARIAVVVANINKIPRLAQSLE